MPVSCGDIFSVDECLKFYPIEVTHSKVGNILTIKEHDDFSLLFIFYHLMNHGKIKYIKKLRLINSEDCQNKISGDGI